MSLTEASVQTVESTTLELDGPIWLAVSSCVMVDVLVCTLIGTREHCCFPCHFFVEMLDDPIYMLVIYYTMEIGRMGESRSLEISTVSRLLGIPQHLATVMRHSCINPTTLPVHSKLLGKPLSITLCNCNSTQWCFQPVSDPFI